MADRIAMLRGSVSARDALRLVSALAGTVDARVEEEVIYPYYRFDARCIAPALAGRKEVSVLCLVDAVNGLGATADSCQLETESVHASTIMDTCIDDDHARRTAERTVTHRLGKSFRTIADFHVTLGARGLVHKRFWVVRTRQARLLVDSTTGGWVPLKLTAA